MNQVMNEGKKEFKVVPDAQNLVAQYLFLYSMSGEPGDFDEYVDYDYRLANAIFFLKTDNTLVLERVEKKVLDFLSAQKELKDTKTNLAGTSHLTLAWTDTLITGQIWSMISSVLAVFLITALMFRSLVAGLINIVPISGAMLMNFGILGLLGESADVGTALSSGIIIGIGIDYTIHFLARYRLAVGRKREPIIATINTMVTSGRAITYNALTVIAGFMVLFASDFSPSWRMGVLVAMGMVTSFLMAMTLLPALLNLIKPGFVFKRSKED